MVSSVLGANEPQLLDKRIVGGYTVPEHTAPYAARLLIHKDGEGDFACGATFISSEYLVTASHCVESSDYPYKPLKDTLRIGYNSGDLTKQLTAKVLEAWPHPKYLDSKGSTDPRYDITVLRVAPISAPYTKPVKIYTKGVSAGMAVLSVGWGQSEDSVKDKSLLRGAKLVVGDNDACKEMYSPFTNNNGNMLCTSSVTTPGTGVCLGDSGGSLMINDNGVLKLIGLPSLLVAHTNLKCGDPGTLTYFTHINSFLDYILQVSTLTREDLVGKSGTTFNSDESPSSGSEKPTPSNTQTHTSPSPTPTARDQDNSNKSTDSEVVVVTKVIT
ncbi:hypothetical protein H4S06_006027, partial [Coemansia sp. BCRC 34490]